MPSCKRGAASGPEAVGRRWSRGARLRLPGILLVAVVTALGAPSGALADPLLSGYGGPGGGEQVLLGSKLTGGGGGGSGSSGPAARPLRAGPLPTAGSTGGGTLQPGAGGGGAGSKAGSGGAGKGGGGHRGSGGSNRSAGGDQRPPGAPPVVPYPAGTQGVSGLPLSGGDLGIGAAALAVLVLLVVALRRVADVDHSTPAS